MRKPDANCANPYGDPNYEVTSADLKAIHQRRIEQKKFMDECQRQRAIQIKKIIFEIQGD